MACIQRIAIKWRTDAITGCSYRYERIFRRCLSPRDTKNRSVVLISSRKQNRKGKLKDRTEDSYFTIRKYFQDPSGSRTIDNCIYNSGKITQFEMQPLLPEDKYYASYEVKRSKFFAFCKHVSTKRMADAFIREISDFNASHNCYAYRLMSNGDHTDVSMYSKCFDDGEPSGAGMSILNVLINERMVDVVVVVTRYYGGIKLGVGGLLRAYSTAASLAIRPTLPSETLPSSTESKDCNRKILVIEKDAIIRKTKLKIVIADFNLVGALYRIANTTMKDKVEALRHYNEYLSFPSGKEEKQYCTVLSFNVINSDVVEFKKHIIDATLGKVEITEE